MAALIGVSLGTMGSGGSIVTLPVLVYVAGIDAHEAVAPALVIVGAVAAAPRCARPDRPTESGCSAGKGHASVFLEMVGTKTDANSA